MVGMFERILLQRVGQTSWAKSLRLLSVLAALLCSASTQASSCRPIDLTPFQQQIGNRQLTFVALDLRRSVCWETNEKDAGSRHAPWSTFKMPHLLIALETQAVSAPDVAVPWDSKKRPAADYWPSAWRRSQTLRSAFESSAAWYFQELVPKIGAANYELWLANLQYGNREVPPGRDDFWLGSTLLISPREQARFLACVATTSCGASPRAIRALETAAVSDEPGDGRIYAKTGSGPLVPGQVDGAFEGWYVGYVRDQDSKPVASFALYVKAASYSELRTFRQDMAVTLLKHLGLWRK
jgi:beta-lactamase class D